MKPPLKVHVREQSKCSEEWMGVLGTPKEPTNVVSIIIPVLNEPPHLLQQTINTIRLTANRLVEIIVVDDCSSSPVQCPEASMVVHNKYRMGGGAARHIGAMHATGKYLLFTDAHMIFKDHGWDVHVEGYLSQHPDHLLCGQCVAVEEPNLEHVRGIYNGARFVWHDPNEPVRTRILTAKWAADKPGEDLYPLTAVMGALYAVKRSYFLGIGGMRMLRGFGCEEELLSVKYILSGGDILMFKRLRACHIFRKKPPYTVRLCEILRNLMMIAHTCLPEDLADEMIAKLGSGPDVTTARQSIRDEWNMIATERIFLRENVLASSVLLPSLIQRLTTPKI